MSLKKNIPWVEKYRPKKLDEILDQNNIIKMLKNKLASNLNKHKLIFLK